jgi:hypothetical protein
MCGNSDRRRPAPRSLSGIQAYHQHVRQPRDRAAAVPHGRWSPRLGSCAPEVARRSHRPTARRSVFTGVAAHQPSLPCHGERRSGLPRLPLSGLASLWLTSFPLLFGVRVDRPAVAFGVSIGPYTRGHPAARWLAGPLARWCNLAPADFCFLTGQLFVSTGSSARSRSRPSCGHS